MLLVDLLLRGELLLGEVGVARQIELEVRQLRLVGRLFSECCVKCCLIGARIDLHQDIARIDLLAFGVGDLVERAIHTGAHQHLLERLHLAEATQIDRHVLLLGHAGGHRHCRWPRRWRGLRGGAMDGEHRRDAKCGSADSGTDGETREA